MSFRNQRAQKIKERFKKSDLEGTVVHWDGKKLFLPKLLLQQEEYAERLAILVSKGDDEQLLGVPVLENSTGISQAEAVCDSIEEWGIGDKIVGMCFDTTASNTGRMKGACTLIEKQLDQSKYMEGVQDDSVKSSVKDFEEGVSEFLRLQLTKVQPRDGLFGIDKSCA
ncbi:hypothetical protein PSTG_18217 [Puccinia striiformis f. sp. tritici PST-78]|uniref:DUF4371 domain-containing protein n=1 Tax=Puccinia striiformis f. sp. tritici PST-78 TaxID=1165861 RepID=A0A0L0UMX7_9BASI|nr:hypothetical protein PSTG_18217 [Puccinia striiformis f. sp. tritici PST-78]